MYAIRVEMDPSLRTNAALREYARNEYGTESVAWLLAEAHRSSRKASSRPRLPRFRIRRVRPTYRLVGHKGMPRLAPSDLQPAP